jgi:hypothetical protein
MAHETTDAVKICRQNPVSKPAPSTLCFLLIPIRPRQHREERMLPLAILVPIS